MLGVWMKPGAHFLLATSKKMPSELRPKFHKDLVKDSFYSIYIEVKASVHHKVNNQLTPSLSVYLH